MALKTFVKVGEITNLSDARYCAGMGVDVLGFCIDSKSSSFIPADKFREIAEWVVGVEYCAELPSDFNPRTSELLAQYNVSYVQSAVPEMLDSIAGYQKILLQVIESEEQITALKSLLLSNPSVDFMVIESAHKVLYEQLDEILAGLSSTTRLLKAYDVNKSNAENTGLFSGYALKGSEEIKPGYKDFGELADILEILETD